MRQTIDNTMLRTLVIQEDRPLICGVFGLASVGAFCLFQTVVAQERHSYPTYWSVTLLCDTSRDKHTVTWTCSWSFTLTFGLCMCMCIYMFIYIYVCMCIYVDIDIDIVSRS